MEHAVQCALSRTELFLDGESIFKSETSDQWWTNVHRTGGRILSCTGGRIELPQVTLAITNNLVCIIDKCIRKRFIRYAHVDGLDMIITEEEVANGYLLTVEDRNVYDVLFLTYKLSIAWELDDGTDNLVRDLHDLVGSLGSQIEYEAVVSTKQNATVEQVSLMKKRGWKVCTLDQVRELYPNLVYFDR
uniref:Uncharacterized protein n=1 Tax=Clandestinovirus TaxID=2831644 RepID=A0A8F8PMH1_9VIRU|nr:hypothetical protein KOM_12_261 [Clandestinovirus]